MFFFRFIEGLKCLGVANGLPNMKELFLSSEVRKLTALQLIQKIEFESVSLEGSNRAAQEARIEAWFSDLICELEGMLSILLSLSGKQGSHSVGKVVKSIYTFYHLFQDLEKLGNLNILEK